MKIDCPACGARDTSLCPRMFGPEPCHMLLPAPDQAVIDFGQVKGYGPLAGVLQAAHDQAAQGKGKARHANGRPFAEQPIMAIARMVGIGYQTGQAMKKAQEATGMVRRGELTPARAELLGAINYLAAAVILIDEIDAAHPLSAVNS